MAVIKIIPQQIQYFPSIGVRQFNIERNGYWRETVYKIKHFKITYSHDTLKSLMMRFLNEYPSKTKIIFHYQHHFITCAYIGSVITRIIDHFIDNTFLGLYSGTGNVHGVEQV